MNTHLPGLCLAAPLALFAAAAAFADDGIIPVNDVRDGGPVQHGPQVVSVRLDDVGLGLTMAGRASIDWSWAVYGSEGATFDLFGGDNERDVINQYRFGAQIRRHFAADAASGMYLFGELAYLGGEFKRSDAETGRTASQVERGVKPGFGVGYASMGSHYMWDVGAGYGGEKKYSADYSGGGHFDSSGSGYFYGSFGIRL